jgi:hypothetical protein
MTVTSSPGGEAARFEQAQEVGALIEHAAYPLGHPERAEEEVLAVLVADLPGCGRDRVAVRVERRAVEHLVHALDEAVGDRVLEHLGIGVDLAPVHAHDVDQGGLDHPVAPQHARGDSVPGGTRTLVYGHT